MSWNYRLCKETHNKGTEFEEVAFTIREVYYKDNGAISFYAENAANLYAESPEDMKWTIEKIQEALNKEVVDLDTLFK